MDILAIVVAIVALGASFLAIIASVAASQSSHDHLRLMRIERKLDRIIAHLDIPEYTTIPEAIRAELLAGNKINAIKLYREQHGVGLKEAKDAIDQMLETL